MVLQSYACSPELSLPVASSIKAQAQPLEGRLRKRALSRYNGWAKPYHKTKQWLMGECPVLTHSPVSLQ